MPFTYPHQRSEYRLQRNLSRRPCVRATMTPVMPPTRTRQLALCRILATCALGACALAACGTQTSPSVRRPGGSSHSWKPRAGTTARPQELRFALVSTNGRRITVDVEGGGGTADWHITSVESTSAVKLRLTEYVNESLPCAAVAFVGQRSVTLRAGLGGRRLIDATYGRPIAFFDGRKLAAVRWLPAGASGPQDRPNGAGWVRVYQFRTHPSDAPIWIEQTPGDVLGEDQYHPNGVPVTKTTVHGRPARMIVQYDDEGRLLQDRLAWSESGYTYSVSSMPALGSQRPFGPDTLKRVADALQPHTR